MRHLFPNKPESAKDIVDIDPECIPLVDAINAFPSLITLHSCSGHGSRPLEILIAFSDAKDLRWISAAARTLKVRCGLWLEWPSIRSLEPWCRLIVAAESADLLAAGLMKIRNGDWLRIEAMRAKSDMASVEHVAIDRLKLYDLVPDPFVEPFTFEIVGSPDDDKE